MSRLLPGLAGLALIAGAAVALGQAMPPGAPMPQGGMPASGKEPPPPPSVFAYRDAVASMHKSMAIIYSGNSDKDFATGMIAHHQGAIDMAKVELQYGTDPEIRKLAADIVAAQEKEIAFMRAWLQRHP